MYYGKESHRGGWENGSGWREHRGRGGRDDRGTPHEGGRGGHGGRGGRDGYRVLVQEPGSHLLFIGSNSCARHKGTERLELQREGKLSFLCLQEIDWITGGYLSQIEEAAREVTRTYPVTRLILFGGCQLELLSVDFAALTKQLTEELNIPVEFHRGCHLIGYGEEDDT